MTVEPYFRSEGKRKEKEEEEKRVRVRENKALINSSFWASKCLCCFGTSMKDSYIASSYCYNIFKPELTSLILFHRSNNSYVDVNKGSLLHDQLLLSLVRLLLFLCKSTLSDEI